MRKLLPITAAIVCGLIVLVDFFVTNVLVDSLGAMFTEGVTILAAFALLLGLLNLLSVHGRRIAAGEPNRGFSLLLIVALVATLAVGVLATDPTPLTWVFNYLYYPLQATMAALLAFFIVSATYRAFRLRNVQALILLVTSLLVLLTQLPWSATLVPFLPLVREWIFTIPVTAGMRGIILGVALGTAATSLRILLAVDHPYA